MNAMMNMNIPINAKTSAAHKLPSGTRFILFASCVMVIAAVDRAVRAGIIADGLRNVFELIDSVETPAAVLAESGGAENQSAIEKIEFSEHYSSSPELVDILESSMGCGSLSEQRDPPKVEETPEMTTAATSKARKAGPYNPKNG